jgi:hypothetical protein
MSLAYIGTTYHVVVEYSFDGAVELIVVVYVMMPSITQLYSTKENVDRKPAVNQNTCQSHLLVV